MLLTQSGFHHLGQSAQYLLPKEGEGERHGWSLQLWCDKTITVVAKVLLVVHCSTKFSTSPRQRYWYI